MKKIILSIFACMAILTSCKKEYSCSCETKYSETGFNFTNSTKGSYSEKMKEKQAKSACSDTEEKMKKELDNEKTQLGLSGTYSVSCELK